MGQGFYCLYIISRKLLENNVEKEGVSMLRSKISIVLAPKVMKEIELIANLNTIKATEFLTIFVEESFMRKREDLLKTLQALSMEIPKDSGKTVELEDVMLPYEIKEIVIPDNCPECGETEDILGNKVLYHAGGYIHCKSCLGKFDLK